MGARNWLGRAALCAAVTVSAAGAPTGHSVAEQRPTVITAATTAPALIEAILARAQRVGPRCDDSQPRGSGVPYDGGSVSALYDQIFHPDGAPIPYLDSYVPQSLLPWDNWDGAGHDLVLLGMYRTGAPSYLVGLDPNTGQAVGTLTVSPSHLGGMAFLGPWLFAGDNPWPHAGSPTVRRYRIDALRTAMQQAIDRDDFVHLSGDGDADPIDATDFMTVDGNSMYTGNHGNGGVPGLMYRYVLGAGGHLVRVEGPWHIPLRAQGLVIAPGDFIFSSDNGPGARGELNVLRRAAPAELGASIGCIWLPAMPEDLTVWHGRLLLIFEGGAQRYSQDRPANRIDDVHVGSLSALLAVTDPPVAPAQNRAVRS